MNDANEPDRRQLGVTLIEVLIGMVVGLFVILAAFSVFTSALESSTRNLKMTNLDQQFRAAMDVMSRHIRRAGYYGLTPATSDDLSAFGPHNPFQGGKVGGVDYDGYQMTLGATTSTNCDSDGRCPCITFSYDGGADGGTPSGTDDLYGFRYDSANQSIEMRKDSDGPPGCQDGEFWEHITDPTIEVTGLTFQYENRAATSATLPKPIKPLALNLDFADRNLTDPPSGCPSVAGTGEEGEDEETCLQLRTVIITIDGQIKGDSDTKMSLRERVRVRNDRYCTEDDDPAC